MPNDIDQYLRRIYGVEIGQRRPEDKTHIKDTGIGT